MEVTPEKSPVKKLINRLIAAGLTLVVLMVLTIAFNMVKMDRFVEQLELKTYDLRATLTWNSKRPSDDVVILQFDDPSLNVLSDEYGVWPWSRDVHADMIHYLNRIGAKMLLYDIMFVSHRKGSDGGDQQLTNAFHHYDNVYLSMNFDNELAASRKLGKDLTPRDIEVLQPLAIPLRSELGKSRSSHLKLVPDDSGNMFFDNNHMTFDHYRSIMGSLLNKGSNIGIINHGADDDGVSRSNPLFFRLQYHKFIKTDALPLKRVEDHSKLLKTQSLPLRKDGNQWVDSKGRLTDEQGYQIVWEDTRGRRTDADGYLYSRTDKGVALRADGTYEERISEQIPAKVDRDGYYIDHFSSYVYQREAAVTYQYFPYLGLRALLDLKFKGKTPELVLTEEGHLQFPGYDIPLHSTGDFLINWYNVNLRQEDLRQQQKLVQQKYQELLAEIKSLEEQIKNLEEQKNFNALIEKKKLHVERLADKPKMEYMIDWIEDILTQPQAPEPYRMISAWEVIGTMKREKAGLPLTPEDLALKKRLQNKIIFIGATAVAAYDIKNTSIHSTMPGVVLQANLFDNMYQGDHDTQYMRRVHPNINIIVTLLLCVISAGLIFRMRNAHAGLLTTAVIAVLYVLISVVMYQTFSLWVNIAMPLVALVMTTTITFMVKYILRDKDYEKTYALATTDSMTGLYNHRFFQDHMRRSIEQATRFKHKFSLVLIDIDFFKKFNDTYGHQAGDEVLRQVAKKLKKSVRNVDIVARYGGEEMAVILDRATEEEALAVGHKLVKAIAEEAYPIAEGVAKHVTISVGVSTYPTHGITTNELIEFSDQGLYRAKENGRNQVGAQYASEGSHKKAEGDAHGHDAHGHDSHGAPDAHEHDPLGDVAHGDASHGQDHGPQEKSA